MRDNGLLGARGGAQGRDRERVEALFRRESGRAVATLIRVLGDFALAADAEQEAFLVALDRWPRGAAPANPAAWITTVRRNRALDRLRRDRRAVDLEPALLAL